MISRDLFHVCVYVRMEIDEGTLSVAWWYCMWYGLVRVVYLIAVFRSDGLPALELFFHLKMNCMVLHRVGFLTGRHSA